QDFFIFDSVAGLTRFLIDGLGRLFIGLSTTTTAELSNMTVNDLNVDNVDPTSWIRSSVRLGRSLSYAGPAGTPAAGGANEFASIIQARVPSVSFNNHYLKAA